MPGTTVPKGSLRCTYLKARSRQVGLMESICERDNMGDATSVIYALFAMLVIVLISFQKQANRDLTIVLSQICSPGSDLA